MCFHDLSSAAFCSSQSKILSLWTYSRVPWNPCRAWWCNSCVRPHELAAVLTSGMAFVGTERIDSHICVAPWDSVVQFSVAIPRCAPRRYAAGSSVPDGLVHKSLTRRFLASEEEPREDGSVYLPGWVFSRVPLHSSPAIVTDQYSPLLRFQLGAGCDDRRRGGEQPVGEPAAFPGE